MESINERGGGETNEQNSIFWKLLKFQVVRLVNTR